MAVWTDEGRCSTCKFCMMDMDLEPFCVHSRVLEDHSYGLNINHAINNYCGRDLFLREEIKEGELDRRASIGLNPIGA